MPFLKCTRVVLVAMVGVCLAGLLGQTGAVASVATVGDVVTGIGTGTFSPGIPTTGCAFQSITADGTFVIAGDDTQTGPFHFNGASSCESLNSGSGSGTVSGIASGTVSYTRTGNIATFSGNTTVNGVPHGWLVFICVYVWTSLNPANSNGWYCVGVWH